MKTFSTSGTGSQQSLSEIENNKIPVYDTKTDAEADLANLTAGQIIATKDEGNETSTPVDVVEDGNMHAVTSNAVYDYIEGKALYNKDTKDLQTGWNNFYTFESLKAGTYIITVSINAVVNDINAIVGGVYSQIGVAGTKNGTLIMDIANDNTDMTLTVYTNNATTGVTLRTVLMKVA